MKMKCYTSRDGLIKLLMYVQSVTMFLFFQMITKHILMQILVYRGAIL